MKSSTIPSVSDFTNTSSYFYLEKGILVPDETGYNFRIIICGMSSDPPDPIFFFSKVHFLGQGKYRL